MTVQNRQSGTEVAQTMAQTNPRKIRHVGRTHVDYWAPRLKKRSYFDRQGREVEIPEWQVRIACLGRREWFNTGTPNRDAAAERARKIYLSLVSAGWERTLEEFKPDMQVSKDGCTVGQVLDQIKAVSALKPGTFEIYAKKFRSLVAGVFNIDGGKAKYDYVNGGYRAWLDRLTPERVNAWKVRELKNASKNPLQLKHTSVTLRSVLLASKALFSPDIRKHLTLRLPDPMFFEGVSLPEYGKHRYKSEIDPAVLLTAAKRELAEGILGEDKPLNPRPELYKILLLGLGAGLRRDEIDKLQWKQILWDRNQIRVETTEHGAAKTAESESEIDVDPGLLEILKGYMPKPGAGSPFVIESPIAPRPQSFKTHHYRANRHFRDLIRWLRGKGLSARNAVHCLRKEFGSQICAQAGIFAASAALRHTSITLTRDFYVDKKQPVVFEVSKLLVAPEAREGAQAASVSVKLSQEAGR